MKLDAEMSHLLRKAAQGFSQRHRQVFGAIERLEPTGVPLAVLDEMEALGWVTALDVEPLDEPWTNSACLADIQHELGKYSPAMAARLLAHHFARRCVGPESSAEAGWLGFEATSGTNRFAPLLTVERDGPNLRLDGTMRCVVGGTHANRWLGMAQLDQGHRALVVVPRSATERVEDVATLGLHGLGAVDAEFSNAAVPENCLLAVGDEVPRRLECARRFVAPGLIQLLAAMLERALSVARNHAQLRRQNGAFLSELPAVQQLLAIIERALSFARVLSASDPEQMCDVEKLLLEMVRAANAATDAGLQVLGGAGYIKGNLIEQLWRDVRQLGQLFVSDPW